MDVPNFSNYCTVQKSNSALEPMAACFAFDANNIAASRQKLRVNG